MSDMFEQLASPFDPSEVDWRVGSTNADKSKGMALAYVDARTVMDRLDTVCGPAGWQNRYIMEGTKTVCEIGVKCGDEWVWKADGAGDSDIEADKGALSDAFKRSAVRWGIGRYLYNLKSPWVTLKALGRTHVIADEARPVLDALLRGAKPVEDKALSQAKAFVTKAIREIGATKNAADLEAWQITWSKQTARLQDVFPDEYKFLEGALEAQKGSFK